MKHIESIFPMRNHPNGIVVVGKMNEVQEPIYDELNVALHEFFESERINRIYTWNLFDSNSQRFNGRVYAINEEDLVGRVGIIPLAANNVVQYQKECDFAHQPFRGTRHSFLGYFNRLMGGGPSGQMNQRERDDFVRFSQREDRGIERIMSIGPRRYYSSPEL